MKRLIFCILFALLCVAACSSPKPPESTATAAATSSDGGPVPTGTWSGDYGPSSDRRDSITVDLHWENTDLTGTVHAGARSMALSKASFQSDTGAIKMEFEAQGNGGQIVHYTVDGKVAGNTMSGSWTRENQHGDFKVTKQ